MPTEQRGEQRIAIDILLNKYLDGSPYLCRAVDISRGGMRLERLLEPSANPSALSLELQLPGSSRVLHIEGVSLGDYDRERAHGVRFTHMSPDDRVFLDHFLAARSNEVVW